MQCVSSRGEGCTLDWNLERQYFLNGLKDYAGEIRAKVFCSGYDSSFATPDIKGSVTGGKLKFGRRCQGTISHKQKSVRGRGDR